jgi:hypothetical protein
MPEENQTNNLTVFLDAVGRTIVAENVESTTETLTVKNPVVLSVQAESGRMNVQLFPLFFREFLGDKADDVKFTFNKCTITSTDIIALDFRLASQYSQLFGKNNSFVPAGAPQPVSTPQDSSSRVVNLFDEE